MKFQNFDFDLVGGGTFTQMEGENLTVQLLLLQNRLRLGLAHILLMPGNGVLLLHLS